MSNKQKYIKPTEKQSVEKQNFNEVFERLESLFPADAGYELKLSLQITEGYSGYIARIGEFKTYGYTKEQAISLLCDVIEDKWC